MDIARCFAGNDVILHLFIKYEIGDDENKCNGKYGKSGFIRFFDNKIISYPDEVTGCRKEFQLVRRIDGKMEMNYQFNYS
jgi:hypothetical protein